MFLINSYFSVLETDNIKYTPKGIISINADFSGLSSDKGKPCHYNILTDKSIDVYSQIPKILISVTGLEIQYKPFDIFPKKNAVVSVIPSHPGWPAYRIYLNIDKSRDTFYEEINDWTDQEPYPIWIPTEPYYEDWETYEEYLYTTWPLSVTGRLDFKDNKSLFVDPKHIYDYVSYSDKRQYLFDVPKLHINDPPVVGIVGMSDQEVNSQDITDRFADDPMVKKAVFNHGYGETCFYMGNYDMSEEACRTPDGHGVYLGYSVGYSDSPNYIGLGPTYDYYILYLNCCPERILMPNINTWYKGSGNPPKFWYFLKYKKGSRCISVGKDTPYPFQNIGRFFLNLKKGFRFIHKKYYDHVKCKVSDHEPGSTNCIDTTKPGNIILVFRDGISYECDYDYDNAKLVITNHFWDSQYWKSFRVELRFDKSNPVPTWKMPVLANTGQPKRHRSKVICLKW